MAINADNIVQAVREPLVVLDADLRVLAGNRAYDRLIGLAPAETVGRAMAALGNALWSTPELTTRLRGVWSDAGEFDDLQIDADFPPRGRRTLLLSGRRIDGGNGSARQVLLAIDDITDRRRAETEVARQRSWFRTTLSGIGDAVIATDPDTRVTYLNPTAESMTAWPSADAIGRPLAEVFNIVNETTRKLVESPVAKAIRLGAIVGLANHTILIARDGAERPIDDSAAPIRDEVTGDIIGVVMVFHDITERRAAQQQLEASEVRYRRLFEAAHDGILILDTTTRRITDVNPFLTTLLGYPHEYFVGKELWEIGIFRDKAGNLAAMAALHEQGSVRFDNLPLQDRNGHRHPVEVVANIYQEGASSVIQCNVRDIGQRVRFDREREALIVNEQTARMEAEAANRAKDLFLATLSHEVRTPLNAILGWASLIRTGRCDAEEVLEGMEVIERNCRVQAQLIEDVLDVSRIVTGNLRMSVGPCELVSIIAAAVDVVRPAADLKDITIHLDLDEAASHNRGDPARLQQVVWNLLTNAVKFSTAGSAIHVTLRREGRSAVIRVADAGLGIAASFLPFVFDRFRQADSTTQRRFGGLGLGLSIVKHIVDMHDGAVEAASEGEGRGATFTVTLPLRAAAVDPAPPVTTPPATGRPQPADPHDIRLDGLRVLVVDDEPDARRLLLKVLGDAGAVVTVAGGVDEAMTAMPDANPQILLSDIAMPGRDGYDLIRTLRAAGHTLPGLPAIALTAFAHKDDRLRVLRAGYQIHMPKPIDPQELVAIVATLAGLTG